RYLRDIRALLRFGAPLIVNGQFPLGVGSDWTWNRFRRRVYQVEHGVEGVYHEMTGVAALAEQLLRLEYGVEVIHDSGFVALCKQANPEANLASLPGRVVFPYLSSIGAFVAGKSPTMVSIG
ncbi:MAG: hypothetical protein ACRDZM_17695, partial [Acidimicrobiia bacterium]